MRKQRLTGTLRIGLLTAATLWLLVSGCATSRSVPPIDSRRFSFETDTFAFANELVWVYGVDESGKQTWKAREPKPDYSHHCFVVARSALQFFQFAKFDPGQPKASEQEYRRLIRKVASRNPRHRLAENKKVVFPGYAHLRELSAENEQLLKEHLGGAWQSYFQRGHWRMVFPFSRAHQQRTAESLLKSAVAEQPAVIHIVCFPELTINHALLVLGAIELEGKIEFSVYDPNVPEHPVPLVYHHQSRSFEFPANNYFKGGNVDIYEIYRGCLY